jgi:hypothetical protein
MVRHLRLLALVTGIAVVAAGIAAAIVFFPSSAPSPPCTLGPPAGLSHDQAFLIVSCDTTVTLQPRSFVSYTMVRLSDQMTLVGQYVASGSENGLLGAFLLNASEFGQVLAAQSPQQFPPDFFWSAGPGPVVNLSLPIPPSPGQYYAVIENIGPTEVSLDWPFGLVLYYGST